MTLDLEFVRAQFPAFSQKALRGQAFFENAGGSYTCGAVIDRLTRFYTERKVQPYGSFEASRLGGEEMDEARVRLAGLMGVTGMKCPLAHRRRRTHMFWRRRLPGLWHLARRLL
jgi:selenocysteine lyase/cysteine desulfurase